MNSDTVLTMANQLERSATTLAILAGGQGSRMGKPKDQLHLGGRPILKFLINHFQWPGPTVLVTAPKGRRLDGADRFTVVAADPVKGEGPLRGVLTALHAAQTDRLIVTTVDMPGWDLARLNWLLDALLDRPKLLGLMCRHDGQIEPFPLALRCDALFPIAKYFLNGERSVRSLSNSESFAVVEAPAQWPATAWANLNRQKDLSKFLQAIERETYDR